MSLSVLLLKETKELVRTRRVVVVPAVFLFFGLLGPILLHLMPQILESQGVNISMPPPTQEQSAGEYFESTTLFGAVALILVGMGAVAEEKTRGSVHLVLSKPVRRLNFIVAKFIATGFLAVGSIFAGGIVCLYYTEFLIGPLDSSAYFGSVALLSLFSLFVLSITVFFSTVLPGQIPAGGASIAVVFALGFLPSLGGAFATYTPHSLARLANELLIMKAEGITAAVLANTVFVVLAILGAWAVFRTQEL